MLQRVRQRREASCQRESFAQQAAPKLFDALNSQEPQRTVEAAAVHELARVGPCHLDDVELRRQCRTEANQHRRHAPEEGELGRQAQRLVVEQRLDLAEHLTGVHLAQLAERERAKLCQQQADSLLQCLVVGALAQEPQLLQAAHDQPWILLDDADETVAHARAHARRDSSHHAEVHERQTHADAAGLWLHENVARMRVGMKEAAFEHLLEVGASEPARDGVAVDACGIQLLHVGDFDAVHPVQREDAPCRMLPDDARRDDIRLIGEHPGKMLGVVPFAHVV